MALKVTPCSEYVVLSRPFAREYVYGTAPDVWTVKDGNYLLEDGKQVLVVGMGSFFQHAETEYLVTHYKNICAVVTEC